MRGKDIASSTRQCLFFRAPSRTKHRVLGGHTWVQCALVETTNDEIPNDSTSPHRSYSGLIQMLRKRTGQ